MDPCTFYCNVSFLQINQICPTGQFIILVFQDLILAVCSSVVLQNTCVFSLTKIYWVEGKIACIFEDLILAVCSSVVLQNTCVFSLAKICWVEGKIACIFQDLILAVCSSVVLQNTCVFSLTKIYWVEGKIACMFQGINPSRQFVCSIAEYMCVLSVSDLLRWVVWMCVCFNPIILAGSSSVVLQNICVFSLDEICWVEGKIACMFYGLTEAVRLQFCRMWTICLRSVQLNTCVFSSLTIVSVYNPCKLSYLCVALVWHCQRCVLVCFCRLIFL